MAKPEHLRGRGLRALCHRELCLANPYRHGGPGGLHVEVLKRLRSLRLPPRRRASDTFGFEGCRRVLGLGELLQAGHLGGLLRA